MCGAADESDHQTEISEHQRDIEWRVWRVDLSEREDLRSWHPAIEMRRQERQERHQSAERAPPPNLRTFKSGAAYEIATEFGRALNH